MNIKYTCDQWLILFILNTLCCTIEYYYYKIANNETVEMPFYEGGASRNFRQIIFLMIFEMIAFKTLWIPPIWNVVEFVLCFHT